MVGQGSNLTRPASLGSHTHRRAILTRQLAQRVVNTQDAINVDIHGDLIHHDGEVNVLLGGQVGDLNGFCLVLGIQDHIHRIGVPIQEDSRTLNFAIGRSLIEQLARLAIAVHPVIHRKPTGLRKGQTLFFIVRHRNFTLLRGWASTILKRSHDRDGSRISCDLVLQSLLNHELQNHGDGNQGRHGSNPGHLVQRRERSFKNPRPRCAFRIRYVCSS